MREKKEEFTKVGLLSYYESLSRKERLKLKFYVANLFALSYHTVEAKLKGKTNISAAELLALQPVIENETWKQ